LSKLIEALISSMIRAGPSAKRPPHKALGSDAFGSAFAAAAGTADAAGDGFFMIDRLGGIRIVALSLALVVAAAVGWLVVVKGPLAAADRPPLTGQMRKFTLHETPRPAPEVAFQDAAGKRIDLGEFHGRLVLVNLWATWCAPCVEEMPSLERLQAALGGDDFTILAVSSDRAGQKVVAPFLEKHGLKRLPIYLDPDSAFTRSTGARGLPTSILVDREGREVGRFEGAADWDSGDATALIRFYLKPRGQAQPPLLKASG
jgi:thiol-disulfide isomerase/thioredoxin